MRRVGGWDPQRLVQDAKHVAGMATAGYITEDHAVNYLALNVGVGDPVRLREAAYLIKQDPDAIPLAVAVLERAVLLAENPPPPPKARAWPDTKHFTDTPPPGR